MLEREEAREEADRGECKHPFERKADAEWPDRPGDVRMVYICETCGHMRGRA